MLPLVLRPCAPIIRRIYFGLALFPVVFYREAENSGQEIFTGAEKRKMS